MSKPITDRPVVSEHVLTIAELVSRYSSEDLQIPALQRAFVWKPKRIADFLDSLYRGFPSGMILAWETGGGRPRTRRAGVKVGRGGSGRATWMLLDGQQRLTSLAAVIDGKVLDAHQFGADAQTIDILFNLDHPETISSEVPDDPSDEDEEADDAPDEPTAGKLDPVDRAKRLAFVVASSSLKRLPSFVSVTEIFKLGTWQMMAKLKQHAGVKEERWAGRLERLIRIRDYKYQVQVLSGTLPYDEVTKVFVRVNSGGMKLRGTDLAHAQLSAVWPEAHYSMESFQREIEKVYPGLGLDSGLLTRSIVVMATGQCRFKSIGNLSKRSITKGWEDAKRCLRLAIDVVTGDLGVERLRELVSPTLILPLAYCFKFGKLTQVQRRAFMRWMLIAGMRGHYSGSSETKIDADLKIVKKHRAASGKALLDNLMGRYGMQPWVEDRDFAGRSQKAGLFWTVFLAVKDAGAKDWVSGVRVSWKALDRGNKLEFHHVFPRAVLKRAGYNQNLIEEIANLAFISADTNRKIRDREPAKYLKEFGSRVLKPHSVPTRPILLNVRSYEEFLAARRKLLSETVNRFLGKYGVPGVSTAV